MSVTLPVHPEVFSRAKSCCLGLLAATLLCATACRAEDVLRIVPPESAADHRLEYSETLLIEAMRRTIPKYGPYRIEHAPEFLTRERLLIEMGVGKIVNVTFVPSQPAWEEQLATIWIPVDFGVTDYRISLIHKDKQATMSAVKTLTDLKALSVGQGTFWTSRKIFDANGFKVVTGADYGSLFRMLMMGRFEHFSRGVFEVFAEFEDRKAAFPDLAIERDLVVQFPLPRYFFVTPKEPRLFNRVKDGLESMVRDGTMMKMMLNYYAAMIKQANFCSRRLIRIPNPLLSPKTPLSRKEFWFNPYDPKTGICAKKPVPTQTTTHR